jgi:dTMP kinase
MNHNGLYVVLEGMDGSGKSTITNKLQKYIQDKQSSRKVISTYHPGSTALGRHLRSLVKNPAQFDHQIEIDNLSRQLLHFVDTISFHKTILEPELSSGSIVLSDRCTYISAVIYGVATGLKAADLTRLFAIYPPQKADLVFVFDTDWEVAQKRSSNRNVVDFYDNQKAEFFMRICDQYRNITKAPLDQMVLYNQVVSLSDLHVIDSNDDIEAVFQKVAPIIDRAIETKI